MEQLASKEPQFQSNNDGCYEVSNALQLLLVMGFRTQLLARRPWKYSVFKSYTLMHNVPGADACEEELGALVAGNFLYLSGLFTFALLIGVVRCARGSSNNPRGLRACTTPTVTISGGLRLSKLESLQVKLLLRRGELNCQAGATGVVYIGCVSTMLCTLLDLL